MTLLDQFSSNGKQPKIVKDRLLKVKSFVLPKKERDFWRIFPYSRLQLINGTEYKRNEIREVAKSYFFDNAGALNDMLHNPCEGHLKDMKKHFYYMQETSRIIWPSLSYYDPMSSLIYTLRTTEFMQEKDKDFFNSFPEWVQKLILIFVNSGIEFSHI